MIQAIVIALQKNRPRQNHQGGSVVLQSQSSLSQPVASMEFGSFPAALQIHGRAVQAVADEFVERSCQNRSLRLRHLRWQRSQPTAIGPNMQTRARLPSQTAVADKHFVAHVN